jgi:hypothetical protein
MYVPPPRRTSFCSLWSSNMHLFMSMCGLIGPGKSPRAGQIGLELKLLQHELYCYCGQALAVLIRPEPPINCCTGKGGGGKERLTS